MIFALIRVVLPRNEFSVCCPTADPDRRAKALRARRSTLLLVCSTAMLIVMLGRASDALASPARGTTNVRLVNFDPAAPHVAGQRYGAQVARVDQSGNVLDAHSDEIRYFNGFYYLYGEAYGCGYQFELGLAPQPFCGIRVYQSRDLVHWVDRGRLFDRSARIGDGYAPVAASPRS